MHPHPYKLSYDIKAHPDGVDKAAAEATMPERGLSDAMIIFSMIYPEDGSLSTALFTKDGRADSELDDIEIFKAWTMLAAQLATSATLDEGKRALAALVFDAVRSVITGAPMPDPERAGRVLLGVWRESDEIGRLRALVADLADPDPCTFDHHGHCQAHGWLSAATPCPHCRAKQIGIGAP